LRKSLVIIHILVALVVVKMTVLADWPTTAKVLPKNPGAETVEPGGADALVFGAAQNVADSPFQDLGGNPKRFADYAGKVLVVNLWATWCAPCIKEMPSLARLARALPADRFQVLAISLDRAGPKAVQEFWTKLNVQGLEPMIDPTTKLGFALKAQGMPTTLILNPQGQEVARVAGALEWDSPPIVARLKSLAP
jgi:thiol-disulfide isomerase/thioredoxin